MHSLRSRTRRRHCLIGMLASVAAAVGLTSLGSPHSHSAGGKRFSEGTSADREVQRTLMELLAQLDGFEKLGKVGGGGREARLGRRGSVMGLAPLRAQEWEAGKM